MVYLTGDTHGELDRFKEGELRRAGKGDFVVVLGDFGFVWDGSKAEQKNLDWLRKRPYTILFLDGSHENYDLLEQYPTEERFGGLVQPLGGNVYTYAEAAYWSWKGRSTSASAERKARTRKSGKPTSTGGRRRCPRTRNTPAARPRWKRTAGR